MPSMDSLLRFLSCKRHSNYGRHGTDHVSPQVKIPGESLAQGTYSRQQAQLGQLYFTWPVRARALPSAWVLFSIIFDAQ